jgi:hypothetical protein
LRDWGILPEIEDDDSDSEDGYDELKTPELEEDQITVVNKGLLQRKNTPAKKTSPERGDPGIFWVGYPRVKTQSRP